MSHIIKLIALVSILWTQTAAARLDLVLTQGIDSALPIAIVPFSGQGGSDLSSVIQSDLKNSGRFKILAADAMPDTPNNADAVKDDAWRKTGVESVVVGKVESEGGNYRVKFALIDTFSKSKRVIAEQTFSIPANQMRRLAHHIADIIYERLTGVRGVFSTRIAYVTVNRAPGRPPRYQLEIADADGYNPRPILASNEPIMSPSWSNDGKKLAYVSFEGKRSQIIISDIASGQRQKVTSYPGINGAPAWSPDNSRLALVLSKDGSPKIYILSIGSGQLQQVTQGQSIDTEPHWTPDGRALIFSSDRGGSLQLYRVDLASGATSRLTFAGDYNARGRLTPDGKRVITLHREQGMYNIAVQDLQSGQLQNLTRSGRDDSPSISPNGMMVLYGQENGKDLKVVSIDGKVQMTLPTQNGRVQDPAWSPFLKP